jgi:tetratricopeptide (TPR) repeat protein
MSGQEYIKSLIKEAELYRDQGLLAQSKETFQKVLKFVEKSEQFQEHKGLTRAIQGKIRKIDTNLDGVNKNTAVPELSSEVQNLIKDLFAFSESQDVAAVEGAMALAKFGQYDRALEEFNKLLKAGTMPLLAAKNIIRCHLALSSPNEAIEQYERWLSGDVLSKGLLEKIRVFLQNILEQKGVKVQLPATDGTLAESEEDTGKEADVLDISTVGVKLIDGPRKGNMLEFDVTFQTGDIISVVISSNESDLIDSLNQGIVLPEMQFYSPIAIFKGKGVVAGKTKIRSGPKQGDYMFDIKIESG